MLSAALIIPALNEEPVIAATLRAIPPGVFRLVIVADNGSTDRTAEVARACDATVVIEPERGYGAACLRALAALPPDIGAVVFLQADLSEDPSEATALLGPIERDEADLVLGSRLLGRAEKGALLPHQAFGNWLATTLIRLLYGHRYTDLCGFRAIRRDALERLRMQDRTRAGPSGSGSPRLLPEARRGRQQGLWQPESQPARRMDHSENGLLPVVAF